MTQPTPHDLVSLLRDRAASLGAKPAFRFLPTGDVAGGELALSYTDLDLRARQLAAHLEVVARPGDRALLLFAPGLEFLVGFFGCLYAGVIAVPIYPPDPKRLAQTLPRMLAISANAGASIVLTTSDIAANKDMLAMIAPDLAKLAWICADRTERGAEALWKPRAIAENTVAFLQYTSGSTGDPKGVVLTHANVMANQRAMQLAAGADGEHDVGVNWLPLFHDFGLIGATLHTIYCGASSVFMSPIAFLKDPLRWLRAISHYRATISGGPDFAFARCARAAKPEDVRALDLSSWRIAINGAEPVRPETMEVFSRVFAPAGFSADAFMPAYGLAEATLIVTSKPLGVTAKTKMPPGRAGRAVASCGEAHAYEVKIVDPERAIELADGAIGEIWIRGEGVAAGYWNQPEISQLTFAAKLADGTSWLRTGDLGFMDAGELYVTGRLKDLIIVAGRNIYPQDLERAAESASTALRPGCSAAFSVELGGEERVALVAEAEGTADELACARAVIRWAIGAELEVTVDPIIFVKPRTILKTSSGKIQRSAIREALLEGALEAQEPVPVLEPQPDEPRKPTSANEIYELMRAKIIAIVPGAADAVRPEIMVDALGLDSLKVVQLAGELSTELEREVPVEMFFGQRLAEIAKLLAEKREHSKPHAPARELRSTAATAPAREGAIFLTGATGFLGRWMLAELLDTTTKDLVCLVRAETPDAGLERVRAALREIGRLREEHAARIRVVVGDLADPDLGLSSATRAMLAEQVGAIFHAGANVSWTLPYAALRAENVGSVEALLGIAALRNIPIHHVSSLGVFPLDAPRDRDFMEDELGELDLLRLGYFQSKWAAEKFLLDARARGFAVSIYRPGLITGDSISGDETNAQSQLFASFLAGIIALGKAPALDKIVDVVPVDYVAKAIVALSKAPAGSFNLVNPAPMRQRELYRALGELGYSVREIPYEEWREEILELPWRNPGNPLAKFAGYYRSLEPERMSRIEQATRNRLPVGDQNTRAHLPPELRCAPFDRTLLATYAGAYVKREVLPARPTYLIDDVSGRDVRLADLYARAKQRQWDGAKRIDWTIPLDPENPQDLPDVVLPLFGSELFERMNAAERTALRRHFHAWQLSQLMHGEQGALLCAAKLVEKSPSLEGRLFAATQVNDEARHLEIFSRLVHDKLELSYPVTPPLKSLLDQIFSDGRWDMTTLGMQVMIEGLALATFALVRDQSANPLIRSIHAFVMEDEARHVAFGRMTLKKYYPELTERERDEREEFVVEASYLLRDRFQSEEVFEALGLPVDACVKHLKESGVLKNYRAELFSRIVPVVRAIGLWGPKVKKAYGAMGVLGFAHVDVDALASADEERAREMEGVNT